MKINETWLSVIDDSGSSIDILDEVHYRKLKRIPNLQDTKVKIYPYRSHSHLPALGKFVASVETEKATQVESTFYVMKGSGGSLLG